MDKDVPWKYWPKENGVPILISDKLDFWAKKIIRNKENLQIDRFKLPRRNKNPKRVCT